MKLDWHSYSYYPYERELARREVEAILGTSNLVESSSGYEVSRPNGQSDPNRLAYFASFHTKSASSPTIQRRLELGATKARRQSTRYSVHGLHDYKGKFNPQVVKALLNIMGVERGDLVLDPFCGSGTTLVEAAHLGIDSIGTDRNPLAVFIANAKLQALRTPAVQLRAGVQEVVRSWKFKGKLQETPRTVYLASWFDEPILISLENLRRSILKVGGDATALLLTVASDLLRDYSQQEPADLRIRRRSSPMPDMALEDRFLQAANEVIQRIESAQAVIGVPEFDGKALVKDCRELDLGPTFSAAVTSPPYAMALPYIDTQRLSLVWLDLISPTEILSTERELIGSREMRRSEARLHHEDMCQNGAHLPKRQWGLCAELEHRLSKTDGFRRMAVPSLLYRYFSSMRASFVSVRNVMRPGAYYALIVGHNHTTIGGVRTDIDTPSHLSDLASSIGWSVEEAIPLQTYKRFGLHATNAVSAETLLLLRA